MAFGWCLLSLLLLLLLLLTLSSTLFSRLWQWPQSDGVAFAADSAVYSNTQFFEQLRVDWPPQMAFWRRRERRTLSTVVLRLRAFVARPLPQRRRSPAVWPAYLDAPPAKPSVVGTIRVCGLLSGGFSYALSRRTVRRLAPIGRPTGAAGVRRLRRLRVGVLQFGCRPLSPIRRLVQ